MVVAKLGALPIIRPQQGNLLLDEFWDTGVGPFNGTLATDGRNARADVDTEGKLTHAGGLLVCAGGKAAPALGDPGRWYQAITRAVGQMVLFRKLTITDVTAMIEFGLDVGQSTSLTANCLRIISDVIYPRDGGTLGPAVAVPADGVTYDLLMVQRAIGCLYYWRVFGTVPFTFLWASSTDATATLYPGFANYSAAWTFDRIRVPTRLWMPDIRMSMGFTAGALSPSDGRGHAEGGMELLSNADFEVAGAGGADVFGTWVEGAGDGAIADETSLVHNGGHAAKLTAGATLNTIIRNRITVVPGTSYQFSFYTRGDGTNAGRYAVYDVSNSASIIATTTTGISGISYALLAAQFVAPAGCISVDLYCSCPATNGGIAYFDDVSLTVASPGLGAGGAGIVLTGATWSVAGGKATNAPVAGTPVMGGATLNGNMETGDPPTGWNANSGSTLDGVADERTGGSGAQSLSATRGTHPISATRAITTVAGVWYKVGAWRKCSSSLAQVNYGLVLGVQTNSASWEQETRISLATTTAYNVDLRVTSADSTTAFFDDISIEPLTLSELFLLPQSAMPDANCVASADLTVVAGFPTGIALVNSTTSPTAGITCAHSGTNLVVRKFTGPLTWTTLIDAAATYVAGAKVVLSYNSVTGALRATYNNTLVGTEQTVTDAEIVACRYIAGFDTGGSGTIDNIVVRNLFDSVPGL